MTTQEIQTCLEIIHQTNDVYPVHESLAWYMMKGKRDEAAETYFQQQILYYNPTTYTDVQLMVNNFVSSYRNTLSDPWFQQPAPTTLLTNKLNLYKDDLTFISDIHRHGWKETLDYMLPSHDPNGITCDVYIDRNFHGDVYLRNKAARRIPYQQPWIGFVHHTDNTTYSESNMVNLFTRAEFLQSLVTCKMLITFSQKNMLALKALLTTNGYGNIPVMNFLHPTYHSVKRFQLQNQHGIVQVGAWYREIFSIYALNHKASGSIITSKMALVGPKMKNYYLDNDINEIMQFIEQSLELADQTYYEEQGICRDYISNKFVTGMFEHVIELCQSVTKIQNLPDADYDDLLSKNVVFLHLVDACAVNTVLECIMRNTPVVVNRLPALVEYLGSNYPLFYDTLEEAAQKLTFATIRQGWVHLTGINKTQFYYQQFNTKISNALSSLQW